MIDAFVEGARSIVQACHLVILAPVMMAVLAARASWTVVAGAVVGVCLGGWLFATRWLLLDDDQIRWSSLAVIGMIALSAWASLRATELADEPSSTNDRAPDSTNDRAPESTTAGAVDVIRRMSPVTAGAVGVVVTAWWRPCVGSELGDILTRAPGAPWGQLLPTIGFMLGISLPIVAVGLAVAAWQPAAGAARRLAGFAGALGVVLAASVLAGQHGEIVARLFAWSEPFV
ncbi:MAG: hypothetical protein AAGG08_17575 [Actinomycetota bacterium]